MAQNNLVALMNLIRQVDGRVKEAEISQQQLPFPIHNLRWNQSIKNSYAFNY